MSEININKKSVSVCIQTYQHASFIQRCLDGILMQKTDFPFEIILGEDHSTDGTREICERYAQEYPDKIKLFLRRREDVIYINGRPTGRFNLIENLAACSGKYIAMCEGDDYWTDENKLQKQVDFMEAHPDYALCFHNAKIVDELDNPGQITDYGNSSKYSDTYTLYDLLSFGESIIPTASLLFRRKPEYQWPHWFSEVYAADLAIMFLMAQFGKVKYIDEFMSAYRINSTGASKNHAIFHKISSRIFFYSCMRNELQDKMYYEIIDTVIQKFMIYGAALSCKESPSFVIKTISKRLKKKNYQITFH